MGVIRAEPARVTDWAAKSIGTVWRAFDVQLVTYAGLLAAIGLVMAYTNSIEGGKLNLDAQTTFTRALMWTGIAVVFFILSTAFDYRWLKTLAWPIYVFQLGLLALTLAIGDGVGGSARWIALGPLTFQFSELAKILMIIVLANYLAARQGHLDSLPSILGACLLVGPPLVLVMLQPDLGTSIVFAAILGGMLWMSGASLKWLFILAAGVIALVPIAWTYILHDYQKQRLLSFLDASPDIKGAGYQLYQAQIAVGSGGWMGKGLTNGTQSAGEFLPVQTTDFVFAILAEELGFIGAIVVFTLFFSAALARPRLGLAFPRPVRHDVRRRHGLDDPLPADRERRHGDGDHADHRDPVAVRDARRGLARQHGHRPGDHPEHQHPPEPRGVVTVVRYPRPRGRTHARR